MLCTGAGAFIMWRKVKMGCPVVMHPYPEEQLQHILQVSTCSGSAALAAQC